LTGANNYIEIHEPFPKDSLYICICGNTKIVIGSTILVKDKCNMKLSIMNWYGRESSLVIGNNLKCNGMTIFFGPEGSSIQIGDNCMTSWNIQLSASDHHPIVDTNGKVINRCGNISIGNHVWIGMNAVLLKNIIIPDNCIIGAGAVVSGKFSESNCILAGNPAEIVRRGINWGRENIISGAY